MSLFTVQQPPLNIEFSFFSAQLPLMSVTGGSTSLDLAPILPKQNGLKTALSSPPHACVSLWSPSSPDVLLASLGASWKAKLAVQPDMSPERTVLNSDSIWVQQWHLQGNDFHHHHESWFELGRLGVPQRKHELETRALHIRKWEFLQRHSSLYLECCNPDSPWISWVQHHMGSDQPARCQSVTLL